MSPTSPSTPIPRSPSHHRVLLSLGHDETWSYNERQAAQTAQTDGVNIVFFGSAAVLRHVRMQPSPLGPEREEVNYRDSSEDPLDGHGNPLQVTGNTWASPPRTGPRSPSWGSLQRVPARGRQRPVRRLRRRGLALRRDRPPERLATPRRGHVRRRPPGHPAGHRPQRICRCSGTRPSRWPRSTPTRGRGPGTYSDMTYYTDPQGQGGVIDTGTVNWIAAMAPCPATVADCPAASVQQITGNILQPLRPGTRRARPPLRRRTGSRSSRPSS